MVINSQIIVSRLSLVLALIVAIGHRDCDARDPAEMTLDQLREKSDVVILGAVVKVASSNRYADLDAKDFDELSVTIEIRGTLKGQLKPMTKVTVIAYKPNGKGMSGNFGSTMRIFKEDERQLHLLYLRKRDDSWMPTSGFVDGGNSHFVLQPSGFVR